jgi:hypothetical protein
VQRHVNREDALAQNRERREPEAGKDDDAASVLGSKWMVRRAVVASVI